MSLTESKVNYQYDDRELEVADTDRYKFPTLQPLYTIGDEIIPEFEEGTLNEWEIELIPSDSSLVEQGESGRWRAIGAGKLKITMRLKDRPAVTEDYEILINASSEVFSAYIDGQETIKLDRYATYELQGTHAIVNAVTYSLEETPLASITEVKDNKCIIHANAKNKLGEIILNAQYNGETYTKTIKIVPLW